MKSRICNLKTVSFCIFSGIFSEKYDSPYCFSGHGTDSAATLLIEWIVRLQESGCTGMASYSSLMTINVNSFRIGADAGPDPLWEKP